MEGTGESNLMIYKNFFLMETGLLNGKLTNVQKYLLLILKMMVTSSSGLHQKRTIKMLCFCKDKVHCIEYLGKKVTVQLQ